MLPAQDISGVPTCGVRRFLRKSKKQVCVLCELCGVSMAEFSGIIETPLWSLTYTTHRIYMS